MGYSNEKSDFCGGLDYVVLTKEGIETHFGNKKEFHEINLIELIDKRIKQLSQRIDGLRNLKESYTKIKVN